MPVLAISPERLIGTGQPCFIIAEAGVNHNGDMELARRLIACAAEAGADAVKFQSFRSAQLVQPDAPKAAYQQVGADSDETQYAMLRRLELSAADQRRLQAECQAAGITFLSTPFDEASVDLLDELGVSAFKVASGDLTHQPLLRAIARRGKAMLVSTGMATMAEVADAVEAIRAAGDPPLALLHCVSCYPTDPADANLRAMQSMTESFRVPVGFSDHTPGRAVALAAVALGACIIEKHVTLDKTLPGPDHRMSLEPDELKQLVREIRTVETALGSGEKVPAPAEYEMRRLGRRSLVAARDIAAGEVLTEAMLVCRRPGSGIAPVDQQRVVGRRARVDIRAGTLIDDAMFG